MVVIGSLAMPGRSAAQAAAVATSPRPTALEIDGPPPPEPPESITRDAQGLATLRAIKLASPLRVDGELNEEVYAINSPISGLIQQEPHAGQPSTERTDIWILFDRDTLYLAARLWVEDMSTIAASEMRHDNGGVALSTDSVGFIFDTFHDHKNGYVFFVNILGGRMEGQAVNERQYNGDWNGVWSLKVSRFAGGWSFEAAIPFKTLRYRPGREQIWGFNFQRVMVRKNEAAHLVSLPPEKALNPGMMFLTRAATIVGLEAPPGAKNIDIKPYAVSDLTTDRTATPQVSDDLGGHVGLDVKYGITQSLALDLTYKTDFAQVEADEQQI